MTSRLKLLKRPDDATFLCQMDRPEVKPVFWYCAKHRLTYSPRKIDLPPRIEKIKRICLTTRSILINRHHHWLGKYRNHKQRRKFVKKVLIGCNAIYDVQELEIRLLSRYLKAFDRITCISFSAPK